jgi:hypothetical protein
MFRFTYSTILILGSLAFYLTGSLTRPDGFSWVGWSILAIYWLILAGINIGLDIQRTLDRIERKLK